MPRRFGSNPGKRLGLPSVNKPMKQKAKGVYPDATSGAGEYGTVAFPTIIEAYNKESDYKRWKLGQEYYFGKGRSWGDQQLNVLARFLNGTASFSDEINERGSREVVTVFPSSTSSENAWYVATRVRGSFLLPQPITSSRITLNQTDPDPANHTLVLDVNGIYNADQLAIYGVTIGDQFEDSAIGPNFPDDLVEKDAGSVALTLIGVSTGSMTLTFDLSRPHRRVEVNKKIYWKREKYDPDDPEAPTYTFNGDGTRYLCSSFSFFCCCPDHLGGAVANLDYVDKKGSNLDTFPLPNANRNVVSAWESEGVGYYRQWRTLPSRRDERRDCKHIHAQRWACGVPWLEPDDYPTAAERDLLEFMSSYERAMDPNEFLAYFRNKRLSWDRFVLSLAESSGLVCFPGGDVRENIRPFSNPMLWHDREEPNPDWCRNNDWWLQRGTQNLKIFNDTTREFQLFVRKSGVDYSILSFLEKDAIDVPKIVP